MQALRIMIGSTTILGRPTDSTTRVRGLFVGRGGFTGWDDGVDSRRESVPRPDAHGEFDLPVLLGSRVFSIDGYALGWSPSELASLRSEVVAMGAEGGRFPVVVDHQGEQLTAYARRGGKPSFQDAGIRHGMHRATFLMQFVAADPRKYGETESYTGPASHMGDFPAIPVIDVTATSTMAGYTVVGPEGRRFVVTQTLPAGQTHRIDMRTGWLYLNGALQIGAVGVSDLWTIPPGRQVAHILEPDSGAGTVMVTVTDTFI